MVFKVFSGFLSLSILGFGFWTYQKKRKEEAPPPVLIESGLLSMDFELQNQKEEKITAKSFQGSYWIVNFFFSRCHGSCPVLNQKMARLQKTALETKGVVKMASFSVDPTNDTPSVLAEYGKKFEANPQTWWFLTGHFQNIQDICRFAFRVPGTEEPNLHSLKLVLVDPNGGILGYFDSQKEEELVKLESLIKGLKVQISS